jgi:hypothetical protein
MKIGVCLMYALISFSVAAGSDLANPDNLQKDERAVSPEQLAALIGRANRVLVVELLSKNPKKLFESRERKDLDALSTAFSTVIAANKPGARFRCMCVGTPAIYIYKDDELLAWVTNHHGQSVRCSLWESNARIKDVDTWLKWFDDRKIDGPRKEVEELSKSEKLSPKDK